MTSAEKQLDILRARFQRLALQAELVTHEADGLSKDFLEFIERLPEFTSPEYVGWRGVYPGMCVDPEACRGFSHCPRERSCCE